MEDIIKDIQKKITKAEIDAGLKPTILFCGCSPQVKKDMHKIAKRIGFKPTYSIKHPTIKVELQNFNSKKIKIDKYQTTTIDYENFEYLIKYLEKE